MNFTHMSRQHNTGAGFVFTRLPADRMCSGSGIAADRSQD